MAANYPDKDINMVVPFAKGGSDAFARALAAAAATGLGHNITIENIGGDDGTLGGVQLVSRPADGYQLLEGIAGSLIIAPYVRGLTNVKWDAFEPVARVQGEEEFLFVRTGFQYDTLDKVITQAKTAKTGIKFCGSVVAGVDSFVYQFLSKAAMFDGTYDAYGGGGPAYDAFKAGTEDVLIGSFSDLADDVASNKVIPIAVASESRSMNAPTVPTLKEKGYDVVLIEWRGVMAPKGTPADRINKLAAAFQAAQMTDSWKTFVSSTHSIDLYLGPSDFRNFLTSEDARFSALIKQLGLGGDAGP